MAIEESRFESPTTPSPINVKGHTLIIPCVSIGSVPQLAIDALIEPSNSNKFFGQTAQLISTIDHRFCVPFLGGNQSFENNNDDHKHQIQGPLRIYNLEKVKLTILQQRSPIVKSRKHDFVQQLMIWVKEKEFQNLVILTSLDAGIRNDTQMGHPFWYVDAGVEGPSRVLEKMRSTLPVYDSPVPSNGLAKAYLAGAVSEGIPTQSLITFAAEGDNRQDAMEMASLLLSLLSIGVASNNTFRQPNDWSLLFGSQINDSMFN